MILSGGICARSRQSTVFLNMMVQEPHGMGAAILQVIDENPDSKEVTAVMNTVGSNEYSLRHLQLQAAWGHAAAIVRDVVALHESKTSEEANMAQYEELKKRMQHPLKQLMASDMIERNAIVYNLHFFVVARRRG